MKIEALRQHVMDIFYAGLRAADPVKAIKCHVSLENNIIHVGEASYDLDLYQHIFVVGAGKAGALMSKGIEDILQDRIDKGLVIVKYDHLCQTRKIKLHQAGHPIPDEAAVVGTRSIIQMLETATERDLVICLISGGGSALMSTPAPRITLQQKQKVTKLLLNCGATIHEINTIRKHISAIKGGQLARFAYPAELVTLVISDVTGDRLDVIASGPTVPDDSTFGDCMEILNKYELNDKIPVPVLEQIQKGIRGEVSETPKKGDPVFRKTHNVIIASNKIAVHAAAKKAESLNYNTEILSVAVEGEARKMAKSHASILKEIQNLERLPKTPACVISGGETTVRICGNGQGGRNQEFVLAAACEIDGMENVVVLSAGTDGTDGPTDAAGAIADGFTIGRAKKNGLEAKAYLDNNNSYYFFEPLNDLIKTGPTNTNVMDLQIMLIS